MENQEQNQNTVQKVEESKEEEKISLSKQELSDLIKSATQQAIEEFKKPAAIQDSVKEALKSVRPIEAPTQPQGMTTEDYVDDVINRYENERSLNDKKSYCIKQGDNWFPYKGDELEYKITLMHLEGCDRKDIVEMVKIFVNK